MAAHTVVTGVPLDTASSDTY